MYLLIKINYFFTLIIYNNTKQMALPLSMKFSERVRAQGLSKAKKTITQAPQNGVTQVCGTGMIEFDLDGNQMAQYADFSSLYIACDITSSYAHDIMLSQIGTMGLVSRVVVNTVMGTEIADISYKNQIDAILIAKQGDANWLNTNGSVMFGCGESAFGGAIFEQNVAKRLLIPISLIGIDQMMFPLFASEKLRFYIYLEAAKTAFTTDTAEHTGLANANITLSNMLLHYDVVELSLQENAELINDFSGRLIMTVPTWQCVDADIPATTTATIQLNVAKTRCRRLLMSQVNSTFIANDTTCSFAMDQALTSEISIKYNASEVKNQAFPLSTSGSPEIFAESIKSSCGRILDIHPSSTTYANYNVEQTADATIAAGDDTCGRLYFEVDFQNGFENSDETIVDGLNLNANTLTVGIKRTSPGTTAARKVFCFVEYWKDVVLDVKLGRWQVYV